MHNSGSVSGVSGARGGGSGKNSSSSSRRFHGGSRGASFLGSLIGIGAAGFFSVANCACWPVWPFAKAQAAEGGAAGNSPGGVTSEHEQAGGGACYADNNNNNNNNVGNIDAQRTAAPPAVEVATDEHQTSSSRRSFGNGRWKVQALPFGAPMPPDDEWDVSFVAVVHRHGARTPLNRQFGVIDDVTWDVCDVDESKVSVPIVLANTSDGTPTSSPAPRGDQDKNQRSDIYSNGLSHRGQLSGLGYYQGYALGDWLRTRYHDRLPPLDGADAVRVRSSNLQRTLLTAKAVLNGMFDGAIPRATVIATVPDKEEYLYPPVKRCPLLKGQFHRAQEHLRQIYGEDAGELDMQLTSAAWGNASFDAPPSPFLQLMDSAMSLTAHKKEFPSKLVPLRSNGGKLFEHSTLRSSQYMAHALFADDEVAYASTAAPKEGPCPKYRADLLRCAVGRVLGDVVSQMEASAKGDAPRLMLVSGHDTTVQPLLAALSYPPASHEWPAYCGAIVFEMLTQRSTGAPFVRILYRGESLTVRDRHGQVVPTTDTGVPGATVVSLEHFMDAMSHLVLFSGNELNSHCGSAGAVEDGGPAGSSMMKD
ncbi:lysophosphatidic acid phosphatase type 6 [Pseudoscourfieldia marina]